MLVDMLMEWVTALHLRAPQSTVILVGTHSDEVADGWYTKLLSRLSLAQSPSSVMADVEKTLKTKHEAWKARRNEAQTGLSTDSILTVESGVLPVSSSPTLSALENGVPELLARFASQSGTTSYIPPSWSLALVVLDSLKYGWKPLFALTCWENARPLPLSEVKRMWVEEEEIALTWKEVQDELPPSRRAGDPVFAMESAMKLR